MAEKEIDDAEFEMQFLRGRSRGGLKFLFEGVVDVAQGAVLGLSLSQTVPQALHCPGIAVFALNQQGLQINQHRFGHRHSPRNSAASGRLSVLMASASLPTTLNRYTEL